MYKFFAFSILLRFSLGSQKINDVCSRRNAKRVYLELGESGILAASNVTYDPSDRNLYGNGTSHEFCSIELISCPSCVVNVIFRYLDLNRHCGSGSSNADGPCRCDYVWISEPPYEDVSGIPFCGKSETAAGNGPSFKSKTRIVSISLLYSQFHSHAFTLEYLSERNRQFLEGSLPENASKSNSVASPFFPRNYPRDLVVEYVITCKDSSSDVLSKIDAKCRIRLMFSDFQVGPTSVMEFYEGNYQRIEVTSGSSFRPPVILSSSPFLTIRFYANGGTNLGFKAFYSFVTDCGGFVENFGGAITMMNMVDRGVKTYDCIWIIRPPENLKTHLFLKVTTFSDFAGNAELQIRQGLTSELPVLETVRYPVSKGSREHVTTISTGFYVSLKASFRSASQLAITYTAFSYNKCFAGSEFLCQNHRCIPGKLSCDGFDHCGDNSDEPALCNHEWEVQPVDRRWYTQTPNYYFPKMERYPDLKTATLVFVVSSLGLILLISALIVLLYRMGSRARQQRDLRNRLQTISEFLDEARIEEIRDDPPVYEPPPDYDDVMLAKSKSVERKKKQDPGINRGSSTDRRNHLTSLPVLEIILPPEVLLSSQPGKNSPLDSCSLNSSQGLNFRSEEITPVPDSPPPSYVLATELLVPDKDQNSGELLNREADQFDPKTCTDLNGETAKARLRSESSESRSDRISKTFANPEATQKKSKATLRRSRSYSYEPSEIVPEIEPERIREEANAKTCKKSKISQLDVAIENEIQNLINSSKHAKTCTIDSFCFKADSFGWDSSDPFGNFPGDFPGTETEDGAIETDEQNDKYWEEFDKQFQNPDRTFHREVRRRKVATLSRRYNSLTMPCVKDDSQKTEKLLLKSEKSSGCRCNGAFCFSASPTKTTASPVRKKRRSLSCGSVKDIRSESLLEFKKNPFLEKSWL